MSGLPEVLQTFQQRLLRKSWLRVLTRGWERRVGIQVQDGRLHYWLSFRENGLDWQPWDVQTAVEQPDVLLCGKAAHLALLFQGETLSYLHVVPMIEVRGSVRDKLKLEALIRLASDS